MSYVISLLCFMLLSLGVAYAAPPEPASVVNVNQATEQQLSTLKGVGKKRAAAILAYRQSHGKFQALQDLSAVPGMSKNLLDRISRLNEHRLAL